MMTQSNDSANIAELDSVVHSAPDMLGGIPVFIGTNVPVRKMFDMLIAGYHLDVFLHEYPEVSRKQAVTALRRSGEILARKACSNTE